MKFSVRHVDANRLPLRLSISQFVDEKSKVSFSEIFLDEKKNTYYTDPVEFLSVKNDKYVTASFLALMGLFLLNKKNYDNWKVWLSPSCGFDPAVFLPFINYYNQNNKNKIITSDTFYNWLENGIKTKLEFSNGYKFFTVTIKDLIKFYRNEYKKIVKKHPEANKNARLDLLECQLQDIAVKYNEDVAHFYGYWDETKNTPFVSQSWFKYFREANKQIVLQKIQGKYAEWGTW